MEGHCNKKKCICVSKTISPVLSHQKFDWNIIFCSFSAVIRLRRSRCRTEKPRWSYKWKNACDLLFQVKLLLRLAQHSSLTYFVFSLLSAVIIRLAPHMHVCCPSIWTLPPPLPPQSHSPQTHKYSLTSSFIQLRWLCSFVVFVLAWLYPHIFVFTCFSQSTAERLWV